MKSTLSWGKVTENIYVGSYPGTPEDILFLKTELGVTGVLNLQSDEDFYRRGIHWSQLWKFYVGQGIEISRVPIVDLKPQDLENHLETGVTELARLLANHSRVYVHCNVGVNRSPTVTIAYLVRTGLSLTEAEAVMREGRECVPYLDVIERWAAS